MKKIPFNMDNAGTLSVWIDGQSFVIPKTHFNYLKIVKSLQDNDAKAITMLSDVGKTLFDYTDGRFVVKNGVLLDDFKPIQDNKVEVIMQLLTGIDDEFVDPASLKVKLHDDDDTNPGLCPACNDAGGWNGVYCEYCGFSGKS
jgi:hypothetical protein